VSPFTPPPPPRPPNNFWRHVFRGHAERLGFPFPPNNPLIGAAAADVSLDEGNRSVFLLCCCCFLSSPGGFLTLPSPFSFLPFSRIMAMSLLSSREGLGTDIWVGVAFGAAVRFPTGLFLLCANPIALARLQRPSFGGLGGIPPLNFPFPLSSDLFAKGSHFPLPLPS